MVWLVGLGGSMGAAARYLLSDCINKRRTYPFPLSTWLANIAGSFLLGLLAGLYGASAISEGVWFFFGAGFCGAFTTFSTFGHETISLLEAKRWRTAVVYVLTSVAPGIGAASLGLLL
ncbi:hypothetical protein AOX59_14285 [Lentibacillus amyloliquefaciens]|uniref:Fluoride-specific ion channel FluC n=1 Tax=Lentibacillus amyloliquefaciens TaxID=1472767 RepID=A0A0U3WCS6_9BACI|nr:hypothetical protein AOX59_14285 [Lentibacillus amyloliquefaciens]